MDYPLFGLKGSSVINRLKSSTCLKQQEEAGQEEVSLKYISQLNGSEE